MGICAAIVHVQEVQRDPNTSCGQLFVLFVCPNHLSNTQGVLIVASSSVYGELLKLHARVWV